MWGELSESVKGVLREYPRLRLTQGRMVLEVRPAIKWDKGKALEFLLESLGFADYSNVLPVYIGADRTDEDAFKVLRRRGQGQGVGILVSKHPKETTASYSLQEPAEVSDPSSSLQHDHPCISIYPCRPRVCPHLPLRCPPAAQCHSVATTRACAFRTLCLFLTDTVTRPSRVAYLTWTTTTRRQRPLRDGVAVTVAVTADLTSASVVLCSRRQCACA